MVGLIRQAVRNMPTLVLSCCLTPFNDLKMRGLTSCGSSWSVGWLEACLTPHCAPTEPHTYTVGLYTLWLINMLSKLILKAFVQLASNYRAAPVLQALWPIYLGWGGTVNQPLSWVRGADTAAGARQGPRTLYGAWVQARGCRRPEARTYCFCYASLDYNWKFVVFENFLKYQVFLTHSETKCRCESCNILLW